MSNVCVLDCTLRDGGYCNKWEFGFDNAKTIVANLVEANVDIIECGFLTNKVEYDRDKTLFTNIEQVKELIPKKMKKKDYVIMLNYNEYNVELLPDCDKKSIDGIRVAFHKNDFYEAIDVCKKIKKKGYKVFVQAMVSLNYSDDEFLNMINIINELKPYAFYIVDSFGAMKGKELKRLFYLVEHNLNDKIVVGFHSHNNMQLAYSNAQILTAIQTNRKLIIDVSIMGMGRGAGNLNTELFVDYLNETVERNYDVKPLLATIDNIINSFYEKKYWGYSLPNYISALHCAHPNYAKYLDEKKTLTFEDMNNIFEMMQEEKKVSYDKEYIDDLYIKYQENETVQDNHFMEFKNKIVNKTVLIIAPGKSSIIEREKIIRFLKGNDVITISINHDFDTNYTDYIFYSNIRRFKDLTLEKKKKCIVTSNISSENVYLQIDFKKHLNSIETVEENAGLMLISFLVEMGISNLYIAGMDGFSANPEDNYANTNMNLYLENELNQKKNKGINKALYEYGKKINIKLLTTPKYIFTGDSLGDQ